MTKPFLVGVAVTEDSDILFSDILEKVPDDLLHQVFESLGIFVLAGQEPEVREFLRSLEGLPILWQEDVDLSIPSPVEGS